MESWTSWRSSATRRFAFTGSEAERGAKAQGAEAIAIAKDGGPGANPRCSPLLRLREGVLDDLDGVQILNVWMPHA